MQPDCQQISDNLSQIQKLKADFNVAVDVGNFDEAKVIEKELAAKLEVLREQFHVSPEEAEAILGQDCLGPKAVEKAYGYLPDKIPPIPFKREELKRAKELGQFLVLRIGKNKAGNPLTMKGVRDALQDRFTKDGMRKITANESYNKAFWENDPIESRWALVSKEAIPGSTNRNYLRQTQVLVKYIQTQVFQNRPVPLRYQMAIRELEAYLTANPELIFKNNAKLNEVLDGPNWQKYARELSALQINQLTRQTPAEVLYDITLYFLTNQEHLLKNTYAWTRRCDSGGGLIGIGPFDYSGAFVYRWRPGNISGSMGVSFSRSL
ncbi:hypothetical protein EPO05_03100 [Patescibacteria group bacterium]|nr:MAG: hypothetical protein EPO05_03100 [Patescibacteria group bacterium]